MINEVQLNSGTFQNVEYHNLWPEYGSMDPPVVNFPNPMMQLNWATQMTLEPWEVADEIDYTVL